AQTFHFTPSARLCQSSLQFPNETLPRQLPDPIRHLESEQSPHKLGRAQLRSMYELVDVYGLIRLDHSENLLLDVGQGDFFDQSLFLAMTVLFDGEYPGPDLDWEFLNHVLPGLNKLSAILDQVIRTKAFRGSYIAGNCKDISALLVCHSRRDERAAALCRLDDH